MFHVQTVSGPIAPDALGHSQIHEHIFVHRTPMAEKNPALRLDDPARSLEELRAYRAAGGGFLADAQPVAAGRDAERLGALSPGERRGGGGLYRLPSAGLLPGGLLGPQPG